MKWKERSIIEKLMRCRVNRITVKHIRELISEEEIIRAFHVFFMPRGRYYYASDHITQYFGLGTRVIRFRRVNHTNPFEDTRIDLNINTNYGLTTYSLYYPLDL